MVATRLTPVEQSPGVGEMSPPNIAELDDQTRGGVTHRPRFAITQTRVGCIDLQHEEILRKRGGEPDLVQFEPPG